MKPDPATTLATGAGARGAWRMHGLLLAAAVLWLGVFQGATLMSMFDIWRRSETYAHGFLIFPIAGWLIWRRRDELIALSPRANAWGLVGLAAAGAGWLLAHAADVVVAQQYALVVSLQFLVLALLGPAVVGRILFPLLFLLFAVPAGDALLPRLMAFTANFTVGALKLSGIPVYQEGTFISVPSGNWSVVEACSGLRYLIASITLGCLYAYLNYRSPLRRAVFMLASVVVPILANGMRAYMIVMIGHLSDMRLATGIDHYIYGWVFFGVVVMLMFWLGSFWREDEREPPARADVPAPPPRLSTGAPAMTLAAAALVALWPAYADRLDRRPPDLRPVVLEAPAAAPGWSAQGEPAVDFNPDFAPGAARVNAVYVQDGRQVALQIRLFRNQQPGQRLISSSNALVATSSHESRIVREGARSVGPAGENLAVNEALIRAADRQILVWQWYWVAGASVADPYMGKLLEARARLMGAGDAAAMVLVYAPQEERSAPADALLQAFVSAHRGAIEDRLRAAAAR